MILVVPMKIMESCMCFPARFRQNASCFSRGGEEESDGNTCFSSLLRFKHVSFDLSGEPVQPGWASVVFWALALSVSFV